MRNFRKTLISTLAVLLCFAMLVGIAEWPYFTKEGYYYQDAKVRRQMAGSIDTIVSGASQGLRAIDPRTLDEVLGCSAYNLSSVLDTMKGRYQMLKYELDRNPVDTVILELSYDALTRSNGTTGYEGNLYHLGRMDNAWQYLSFFIMDVKPEDYVQTLYDTVNRGITIWKQMATGTLTRPVQYETHGFVPCAAATAQPEPEEYPALYHTKELDLDKNEEDLKWLTRTLELCRERNIRVILVTTPVSEGRLWEYDGYDTVRSWYRELSEAWDLSFYDFNLYRDKVSHYPEDTSFYDKGHMSLEGAEVFSRDLAEVLDRADRGEDTDGLFYDSYEEAIRERWEALGK